MNSMGNKYIDNCLKKWIILWGQKHCDWGGKLRNGGQLPPMLKKALGLFLSNYEKIGSESTTCDKRRGYKSRKICI